MYRNRREGQTVPYLHDYSTCCRHVNIYAHQLPYMYNKHLAHFNIHTTLGLQGLSIHSAHVPTIPLTSVSCAITQICILHHLHPLILSR